jgi:hypothetical protein
MQYISRIYRGDSCALETVASCGLELFEDRKERAEGVCTKGKRQGRMGMKDVNKE